MVKATMIWDHVRRYRVVWTVDIAKLEKASGVGLVVEVDHQCPPSRLRKADGDVVGGGGLPHSPLLIPRR